MIIIALHDYVFAFPSLIGFSCTSTCFRVPSKYYVCSQRMFSNSDSVSFNFYPIEFFILSCCHYLLAPNSSRNFVRQKQWYTTYILRMEKNKKKRSQNLQYIMHLFKKNQICVYIEQKIFTKCSSYQYSVTFSTRKLRTVPTYNCLYYGIFYWGGGMSKFKGEREYLYL